MDILKIIVSVIFVIIGVVLTVIVLLQEGKSNGLGSLGGGSSDTYWSKNKSRSAEGNLERITKFIAISFMICAILLNLKIFA